MNRIIASIIVIVGVTVGVAAATGAFYSDIETSANNIMTAGEIDLRVDHTYASYNEQECEESCEADTDTNLIANGSFEEPEVEHSAQWNIFPDGSVPGWAVEWMPGADNHGVGTRPATAQMELHNGVLGSAFDGEQYTELDSDWDGPGGSINGEPAQVRIYQDITTVPGETYELRFAFSPRPNTSNGENVMKVYADGDLLANISDPGGGSIDWTEYEYEFSADGASTRIAFEAVGVSNSEGIFVDDVRVHPLDCETTIDLGECRLWKEKDLGEGDFFFHFTDIKPGDHGRNVISLHVYDNDAWACLIPHDLTDSENDLIDTEADAGDESEGPDGGELSSYISFFSWNDVDNDGQYDPDTEGALGGGLFGDQGSLASLDAQSGTFLTATSTRYVGFAWCAGDITADDDTGEITCDGTSVGNDAQTDSLTASLVAYAEQVRHNGDFGCDDIDLGVEQPTDSD